MAPVDITRTLEAYLLALDELGDGFHPAHEIADEVDRTPGTVRNQMQPLVALGFVESRAGARGGYQTTEEGERYLEEDFSLT